MWAAEGESMSKRERDAKGCFFNIKRNWNLRYLTVVSLAAHRLLMESCNRIVQSFCPLISPDLPDVRSLSHCRSRLIYSVVFIPPPVYYGCVLCYWVRWIYQGRRVGEFAHQGDNYWVIGVLTLSARTIFVSSLLASPLHKHTQHVWYWKSTNKAAQSQDPSPLTCAISGAPFWAAVFVW